MIYLEQAFKYHCMLIDHCLVYFGIAYSMAKQQFF